ncbi:ComEA family DNA-binding protein [Kribbella amoyensis]|uniref:ComEA family DNA-binding protein n=1 Tax=Kribbella amoyensis TaxID=996641 RepID=UPI0014793068|nr:helix-hairpin-helix domain-containing protein [Kribbella amoyensis]
MTFGLGAAPLFGVLAAQRRSRELGVTAVVYGAGTVTSFALLIGAPEDSWMSTAGVLLLFGFVFTSAAHAALIVPAPAARLRSWSPSRSARPAVPALPVEVRREQARRLAERYPAVARELCIGRPDQPRALGDGGLLDLNEVSTEHLRTVVGIGPAQADAIVTARRTWGRYGSVADLVHRGLMPLPLPPEVEQRLVVIRPGDTPPALTR